MKIDEVLLDEGLLIRNLKRLKEDIPPTIPPTEQLKKTLWQVPTTHTFGFEKMIPVSSDPTKMVSIYPYKRILFEDKALLSDQYRRKADKRHHDDMIRSMNKARKYGLDHYVFTYLGTHEYYYAKCRGSNIPAFGVFISVELDFLEKSNATMYDLESSHVEGRSPSDITLNPTDAREITAYEITNKYKDDFFNYWICDDYAHLAYHNSRMWELKREFHYYEKVEIDKIKAIIWPVEKSFDPNLRQLVVRQNVSEEIGAFRKQHKDIPVYTYEWNEPEGENRFHYASYLVTREFIKSDGNLLSPTSFNDKFVEAFPAW